MLVLHVVFGKTVQDISLNAVANLGYADCRFRKAVYPGDTLNAVTEVIGLKENSNSRVRATTPVRVLRAAQPQGRSTETSPRSLLRASSNVGPHPSRG